MSAAVIRPFYDFGDVHLKNQTSSRLNLHNNNANNNNNNNSLLNSGCLNNNSNGASPTANSLANVIGQSSMPALAAQFNSGNTNNSMTNNMLAHAQIHSNVLAQLSTPNPFSQQLSASNNNNNNNAQQQQLQQQQQQQFGQQSVTVQQQMQVNVLQQRINAAAAAMVAQHQHQHNKILLHSALTRAVSHPQGAGNQIGGVGGNSSNSSSNTNVVSLVNTLMENLGHRKLERTQSEPLPQVNTSRYKTELCRPFEEAGECKYGEKCQFAHGMHELRNLQRHPKYKTELCRTFHSVGFCPYGPRCHFVHNAEEARNHNRAVHAAYVRAAAAAGQPMPMSPPMSMSTGSDRASPTGSLSLSPTNSMASFFPDQTSPNSFTSGQVFSYPQSPPQSPMSNSNNSMSPVATPPPQQQQQMHHQQQQLLGNGNNLNNVNNNNNAESSGEARLPIFNQLSSTMDAFKHLAM